MNEYLTKALTSHILECLCDPPHYLIRCLRLEVQAQLDQFTPDVLRRIKRHGFPEDPDVLARGRQLSGNSQGAMGLLLIDPKETELAGDRVPYRQTFMRVMLNRAAKRHMAEQETN